jgi:FMN-dependent NADH-azoreductase
LEGRSLRAQQHGVAGKKAKSDIKMPAAIYSGRSPIAFLGHQEALLKAALSFNGATDIITIRAEGDAVPDLKPGAIAAAQAQIAALTA